MDEIEFSCPSAGCQQRLKVAAQMVGQWVQCPTCGSLVEVPRDDRSRRKQAVVVKPSTAHRIVRAAQTPTSGPSDPLVGTRLGGFQILERLGQGGMGAVYKALNAQMNRTVALKIISDQQIRARAEAVYRFLREAELSTRIKHPNIVTVHSVGREASYHFIEMEFVDGQTLRQRIEAQALSVTEATRIIREAAKGISAAHAHGVVHGDIKPENILVDKNGDVKVSDFGAARFAGTADGLADAGLVLGSPHYISPEQAQGKAVDARSDIYSLGATYFHALTGRTPFQGETAQRILEKHVQEPLPSANTINPAVPSSLVGVLYKMMDKDPNLRYQDCGELVADLRRSLLPRARLSRAASALKESRILVIAMSTIVIALLVLAIIIFIISYQRTAPSPPRPVRRRPPTPVRPTESAPGRTAPHWSRER